METLTLTGQFPMSNSSKLFSHTTICSSFKWIEPLFFRYRIHRHTHRQIHRQRHIMMSFFNLELDWIMSDVELFRAISMFKFQVDLPIIFLSYRLHRQTGDRQTHKHTHTHTYIHTNTPRHVW